MSDLELLKLKSKIFEKGFKNVEIEYIENLVEDEFKINCDVYFNFIWNKDEINKDLNNGWQEFNSNSEEELLKQIDDFILKHKIGNWILKLNK